MLSTILHKEDIKGALRKRHGTVKAFAEARSLKPQAVADWLRGRTSARVASAVEAELSVAFRDHSGGESIKMDDSAIPAGSHRLNRGGR